MNVASSIESKLKAELAPDELQVVNESDQHNVPPGSESHFRVLVVATAFESQSRLARHRRVHSVLSEELGGALHALAVEALTPSEWLAKGKQRAESPECRGGSAASSRELPKSPTPLP